MELVQRLITVLVVDIRDFTGLSRRLSEARLSELISAFMRESGVVLAAAATEPAVVIERDVPATMRDGVVLRADVHRPDSGGPYPVLVMRTPYGKHLQKFEQYVKAGYIVVCQDVRGRYASDGTWESFIRPKTHDAEDGYDTVQWAAQLPASSGKVGTIGLSYSAYLQWRLAPLRPPALVAMSAHSIAAHRADTEGPGTIRPGRRLRWWIVTMAPEMRRRANRPGTHTEAEAAAFITTWRLGLRGSSARCSTCWASATSSSSATRPSHRCGCPGWPRRWRPPASLCW